MLPTIARGSAAARTPLIRFIGKRQWPSRPEAPHPHPFAPPEIKQSFGEFVSKSKSPVPQTQATAPPSKSKSGAQTYEEFWHAPERLWRRNISKAEMDAIYSGGASCA
ncbi:hypothetical protein BXZ70DRAFT_1004600 [Cristinia sonorae]|uniref:Uncharacterized protein n=1 Tax=Cristinia sonorae TaxID=1940300 RepID=A0A8K0UYZ5_9AGAR|nr:hypothetical protein BXZ70DRAFT_1004600 [Cristinia sonorae]